MASEFITGAVIGGIFTLLGSIAAGLIAIKREKISQTHQDKRVVAKNFAEQEAELVRELSYQVNRTYRIYDEGVRHAANHILSEKQYKQDFHEEFRELQKSVEKSTAFLTPDGEEQLRNFVSVLIDADGYMRRKAVPEEQLGEVRGGNVNELLKIDDAEINLRTLYTQYYDAKEALRTDVSNRLEAIDIYEGHAD